MDPVGDPVGLDQRVLDVAAGPLGFQTEAVRARGRRVPVISGDSAGQYVRARPVTGSLRDLALDATLLAAARRWVEESGDGVALEDDSAALGSGRILRGDLREKVRVRRAGAAITFVVDASGSMRKTHRMVETKGAVLALLLSAYVSRDRVALVAFRGHSAEVLLPHTSSVEQARERLERLPAGGRTPLAEGLRTGLAATLAERRRQPQTASLLVVVSDGKPNWARSGQPVREAESLAWRVRQARIPVLFLDTDPTWQEPGIGQSLCQITRGRYLALADLSAQAILQGVSSTLERIQLGVAPIPASP